MTSSRSPDCGRAGRSSYIFEVAGYESGDTNHENDG